MATANPVVAGDALARGIKNTFDHTWQRRYQGVLESWSPVMDLGIASDKFEELYGYYETAPYIVRRARGEAVRTRPFRARNFAVENLPWSIGVEWYRWDRIYDQLKGLERKAREAGANAATLPERVFFQILTAAANADLLAAIPNAPDGAALFSATDGASANRFGVSGGNIITGTGVATSQAIREDFFNARERFAQFQDPEGQPALPSDVLDGLYYIFYNVANDQVYREAFAQTYTLTSLSGASTTNPRVAAATTNVILDAGLRIKLVPTQRITDNDWAVFLGDFDLKPIFEQVAEPLYEVIQTEENSDIARRTDVEGVFWKTDRGYGVNLPLGAMQVNN